MKSRFSAILLRKMVHIVIERYFSLKIFLIAESAFKWKTGNDAVDCHYRVSDFADWTEIL